MQVGECPKERKQTEEWLKTEQMMKDLQKVNDLKEGQPLSTKTDNSLSKTAEQAANYALNFVPAGDLAKLLIKRIKDPDYFSKMSHGEVAELLANTAIDFVPGGKGLRLANKALSPLGKYLSKKM